MAEYRVLNGNEITRGLFDGFIRRQEVNLCWRKREGQWQILPDPFLDDWSETDYEELLCELKDTIMSGGIVYGAFYDGRLKGFASVKGTPIGSGRQYFDLTNVHVSQEMRGEHIGRTLFLLCAKWARRQGGEKLYISAHSADETQKFYRGLGCMDAAEISREHAEKEPYDCQLEYLLTE